MKTPQKVVTLLLASVALFLLCATVAAQGLVGFYGYPDAYNRGIVISSFIPGTSADGLHRQGQLFAGDIVTSYGGVPVHSPADVRRISASFSNMPNAWARMTFLTPQGQPFWHYVRPGLGVAFAAREEPLSGEPQLHQETPYVEFRKGSNRPGSGREISPDMPPNTPPGMYPDAVPSFPPEGRPQGPPDWPNQGWPAGPGRP